MCIRDSHKVDTVPVPADHEISRSVEREAQAQKDDEEHDRKVSLANAYWQEKANAKDWDCIKADLSVYRYSGVEIPRTLAEPKSTDGESWKDSGSRRVRLERV